MWSGGEDVDGQGIIHDAFTSPLRVDFKVTRHKKLNGPGICTA